MSGIPNKSAALYRRGKAMAETVATTEICRDWQKTLDEMIAATPAEELIARMFSLIMGKRQILGDDQIGASQEQAQKILNRDGERSGRSSGRPPFGKKPFGRKPFGPRSSSSDARPFDRRSSSDRKPFDRSSSDRGAYQPSSGSERNFQPRGDDRRPFSRPSASN